MNFPFLHRALHALPPSTRSEAIRAVGALALMAVIGLALPLGAGLLFGWVIARDDFDNLGWLLLGILLAAGAAAALELTAKRYGLRIGTRLGARWEQEAWWRLVALPFRRLSGSSPVESGGAALAVATMIQRLEQATPAMIGAMAFAVGNGLLMVAIQPGVALVGLLCAATAWVLLRRVNRQRAEALSVEQERAALLQAEALEWVRGADLLRVAGAGATVRQRLAERVEARQAAQRLSARRDTWRAALFSSATALPCLILFAFSDLTALEPGEFFAYLLAFGLLMGCLRVMAEAGSKLAELRALEKRAEPLWSAAGPIPSHALPLRGKLEVRGLSFRYGRGKPPLFAGLMLDLAPGEVVNLSGPTGSGKSTLLRLLAGLEFPEAGSIRWDGQEGPERFLGQIGVVWQRGLWAPGDLLSNIVGESDLSPSDAWRAAEQAGVAAIIRRLPMQMQTLVAEGAANFSTGERQRLLIARALARQPRVLLLDHAVSALSTRETAELLTTLRALKITTLLATPRPLPLNLVDRVIALPGNFDSAKNTA